MDTINEKLCLHDELCNCLKDAIPLIKDLVSKSKHLSRQILVTKKLSSEFFKSLENVVQHMEASAGKTDESFQRFFQWGRSLGLIMSDISEALMEVVDTTLTDKVEKLKLTVQQQKLDKKFIHVCNKRIRKNEKYARKLKKNKAKKSKSNVACFNENVEISLYHQMTTFKDYMSDLLDRKDKVRQDSCNSIKDSVYGIFEQLLLFNVALDGVEERFSSSNISESVDCNANNEPFSVIEENTVEDIENLEDPEIDERTYTIYDENLTFVRKDPFTGETVFKECLTTRELMECNANDEAFSATEESPVEDVENLEDPEIDERTYTIYDENLTFVRKDPFTGETVFKECLTTRELMECNANDEAFSATEESPVEDVENLEDPEIDERTYTIYDENLTFVRKDPFTGETVFKECLTTRELMGCNANDEAFSATEESPVEDVENLEDPEIDERKYRFNDGDFSFRRINPFKCAKMFMEFLKMMKLTKCSANSETFSVIDESPVEGIEICAYPEIDENTYNEDSIVADIIYLERFIMYWKYLNMKKNHASFGGDSGFQLRDPSLNESSELNGSVLIQDSWKTDNSSIRNYYEHGRTFSDIYKNACSDDIFKRHANDCSDLEGSGDCSLISSNPSTSTRLTDYRNNFSSELAMRSEMTRGENTSLSETEEREGKY
ncbi:E1A-binding protein [Trichinella pseudospiralis]